MSFYTSRLTEYKQSIAKVAQGLITANEATPYVSSDLNSELSEVAPGFPDADYILNYIPIWPLLTMILTLCMCLGSSAAFHLLNVKSPNWNSFLARLDYGGISFAIFGCNLPIIFYSFACTPELVQRYIWVAVMGVLTGSCFVTSLMEKFDSPKFRPIRGFMFIAAGLSGIAVFLAVLLIPNDYKMDYSATVYAIGGYIFIQGAVLYMLRVPERCRPGTFDLCGASHQLFHFAVLLGMGLFFWQNYLMFNDRQIFECPIELH